MRTSSVSTAQFKCARNFPRIFLKSYYRKKRKKRPFVNFALISRHFHPRSVPNMRPAFLFLSNKWRMPGKCSANGTALYGICSSSNDRKVWHRWCCTVRCVPHSTCTSTCRSSHGTVQCRKCRYFAHVQCRCMVGMRQRIWTAGAGQGGKETPSQVSVQFCTKTVLQTKHFLRHAQQCDSAAKRK